MYKADIAFKVCFGGISPLAIEAYLRAGSPIYSTDEDCAVTATTAIDLHLFLPSFFIIHSWITS